MTYSMTDVRGEVLGKGDFIKWQKTIVIHEWCSQLAVEQITF